VSVEAQDSLGLLHLRDVSNWQGPVDWRAEKRAGLAGVYVKVSEGPNYTDPTAARRLRNAQFVGIPTGGYHFCTPGAGTPEAQADRLLSLAPRARGQLRPCLDCEANPLGLNPAQLAAWYLGAVLRVFKRAGYYPTVYGSPSYLSSFATYHGDVFGRCPLWLADYGLTNPPAPPAPWSHWAAWQWTSSAHDPAIPGGTVDDSRVADLTALKIPAWAKLRAGS
jgi:lysozyme